MKVLALISVAVTTLAACSNHTKSSDIPLAAEKAFAKLHPETKGDWKKEGANFEVSYADDKTTGSYLISPDGGILESEMEIAPSELPEGVHEYLKNNYPEAQIKEAAEIVQADGSLLYEAEVYKKDLMFDSKGNFLSAVDLTDED